MLLTAAPRPLGAGVLQVRATGTAFRHGWPAAKCSSKQRPRPLVAGVLQVRASDTAFRHGWPSAKCSSQQRPGPWGRCASGAGHGHCVSSRLACGQMLLTAAPPALSGGCASGAGQWHCVSSRLAFGQMFLTAAPRPLVAGVLQVRASGTAFRHGWPAAKCSSKQHPRPLGRVCFGCGPWALRFVTVGLRPNVPQSSAPALGTRISKQVFHKEYSQC